MAVRKIEDRTFEFFGQDWKEQFLYLKLPEPGSLDNWVYGLTQNWGSFSKLSLEKMDEVRQGLLDTVSPVFIDQDPA